MGFKRSRDEALLLLGIAVAINLALIYGLATRPVMAYHLTTEMGYNETIDFESQELVVNLEAENRGLSPARVELTLVLYNASLIEPERVEPPEGARYHTVEVSLDDPIKRSSTEVYTIKLRPEGEPDYMVFIFEVSARPRWDPFSGFFDSFMVTKPERPTALLLKRIDGTTYMRTRQR